MLMLLPLIYWWWARRSIRIPSCICSHSHPLWPPHNPLQFHLSFRHCETLCSEEEKSFTMMDWMCVYVCVCVLVWWAVRACGAKGVEGTSNMFYKHSTQVISRCYSKSMRSFKIIIIITEKSEKHKSVLRTEVEEKLKDKMLNTTTVSGCLLILNFMFELMTGF